MNAKKLPRMFSKDLISKNEMHQKETATVFKNRFYFIKMLLLFLAVLFFETLQAQWSSNPAVNTAICIATGDQSSPTIVADGAGGSIITWYDLRSGSSDIYAQRINAAGVVQWTANGVAICTATGEQ